MHMNLEPCFSFFFLEHVEELHVFVLRRKENLVQGRLTAVDIESYNRAYGETSTTQVQRPYSRSSRSFFTPAATHNFASSLIT